MTSPIVKAKDFPVGTIRAGRGGKKYKVIRYKRENKFIKRWSPVSITKTTNKRSTTVKTKKGKPKIGNTRTVTRDKRRVKERYGSYKGKDGIVKVGWHIARESKVKKRTKQKSIVIPIDSNKGLLEALTIGKINGKPVGPYSMNSTKTKERRDALQVAVNKLTRKEGGKRQAYRKLKNMIVLQRTYRKGKLNRIAYKNLNADIKWLTKQRDKNAPYKKGYTLKRQSRTRKR